MDCPSNHLEELCMFKNNHRNGICCIYRIQSEVVDFQEEFLGGSDVGLLLDRGLPIQRLTECW